MYATMFSFVELTRIFPFFPIVTVSRRNIFCDQFFIKLLRRSNRRDVQLFLQLAPDGNHRPSDWEEQFALLDFPTSANSKIHRHVLEQSSIPQRVLDHSLCVHRNVKDQLGFSCRGETVVTKSLFPTDTAESETHGQERSVNVE